MKAEVIEKFNTIPAYQQNSRFFASEMQKIAILDNLRMFKVHNQGAFAHFLDGRFSFAEAQYEYVKF